MLIQKLVNLEDSQFPVLPLGNGFFTIVDADVYVWAREFSWSAVKSASCYYAIRKIVRNHKSHYIRLHREIMRCPAGMQVHHINGNTLDNRRCNLVCVTREEHDLLKASVVSA